MQGVCGGAGGTGEVCRCTGAGMQVYASVAVEKMKEVQELCRSAGTMQECRCAGSAGVEDIRTSGVQGSRAVQACRSVRGDEGAEEGAGSAGVQVCMRAQEVQECWV